jgi:hypothetical protein
MKDIEQLVDETMESLDGVQRAPANPFLHTRIVQKLKSRQGSSYQRKLMPVLAVALVLFISLNVLSYLKVNNEPASPKSTGTGIENFANEYNLSEEGGL